MTKKLKSSRTTLPVMIRVDPEAWKEFQQEAADRDLMPAQLIRMVMREWLDGYYSSLKSKKSK